MASPPDSAGVNATNCTSLRAGPCTARLRNSTIESDELTFDPQGRMLLIRGNDVIRLADGMTEVILRGVLGSQGGALRFLTDGSLLVADFTGDEVIGYNLPSRAPLFSADTEAPMKIAVGPRDRLYVSSNDGFIYMVNTATGQEQVVASPDDEVGGLAFSPDHQTLYAGLLTQDAVAAFPVRPQGQLGPRTIFARNVPYPYALVVDECGNVYSSGDPGGQIRRIRNGRTDVLLGINRSQLWGLAFGSGKHGWSDTALYVSSNSEGVAGLFEVEVGVRGAPALPPGPSAELP
jgi:WD40 repeat protein